MKTTCYGCRHLIQGGDGSAGCLKFPHPQNQFDAYPLDEDRPEPLYADCYERTEARP